MKRVLVVSLFICLAAQTAVAGQLIRHEQSVRGTYVVRIADDVAAPAAEIARELARAHGVEVTHVYSRVFKGFAFKGSEAAAAALAGRGIVAYVEEAGVVKLMATQSPAPSWGLDRIDQRLLPLNNAYRYQETGAGSTIYIVDSGVNAVADLAGRIAANVNFVTGETRVDDCANHGTSVAAIAAGSTFGVAKGATIINYRVSNCNGGGTSTDLIAALDNITAYPGQRVVVNLSLITASVNNSVDNAVLSLINDGISVVTAAFSYGYDACDGSPAHLGGNGGGTAVITVSSADASDTLAGGHGRCVDLLAPTNVQTVASNGVQTTFGGTSASVPHVSGALALLQERHQITYPYDLKGILKQNASPGIARGVNYPTPNLLLHTLPTVTVTGTNPLYSSQTTTASVTPVSGAAYTWSLRNGTLLSGQGTTTLTYRAGCSALDFEHATAAVEITTASGTSTGILSSTLIKPSGRVFGTQYIQAGQSATIGANLLGIGPWNMIWSDNFQETAYSTPTERTVSPTETTSYWLVAISDAYGCSGTTHDWATVFVE